jgi:NAD(P)-dependent dehydrogenase (short-subunit alcohol dehydrogenase family)
LIRTASWSSCISHLEQERIVAEQPLALVSGGASGIGRATVILLLLRGMRVIALDKSEPGLGRLRDECPDCDRLITAAFDLSRWREVPPLCQRLRADHGPVTRLVNNAGVWPGAPLAEMSDDVWQLNFDVNVSAPFALIRALSLAMGDAGGGAIVNVASRNAFRSSVNNSAYDASKAALIALTRTAAGELARCNIQVNAVCPGVIATPGDAATIDDQLFKAAYTKLIPMDRYGTPEEIAAVIAFLLSDDASFLTGQAIIVDGGQIACQDNERFMQIPGLRDGGEGTVKP